MGRNPSGSAGTGQAKMGSQTWRGRGGGSSVLRLRRRRRRRGVGVVQLSLGVAPSSPSSAVYVWSNILLTEITEVAPRLRPMEAFPRGTAWFQSWEEKTRKRGGSLPPSSTLH